MPSTSKKQAHLMAAVAHNPAFAKKVGIPQSVGKDFNQADKGKTFKKGGDIVGKLFKGKESMKEELAEAKAIKSGKITPMQYAKGEEGEKKMAKGGMTESMGPRTMSKDVESGSNKLTKFGQSAVQKRGMTKGTNLGDSGKTVGIQKMAKGGKVKRYDEGGYTGDDEIVKYRMGMTDKPSPSEPAIEDESDRGNVSPAAAEFNKDTGNEPSTPKAAPKAVSKPVPKEKTLDSAPKASAPTKQQKAAPTMVKDQPFKSKSGMTGSEAKKVLFGSSSNDSPRMKAAKRDQAMSGNWSMKSGGKVGPSRGDGIAQRGRTKGKYC